MTEAEFIDAIDCKFPYRSRPKWRRLIAAARDISTNACFMVLHEVCRPPRSARVTRAVRYEIFDHLNQRIHHPLLTKLRPLILTVLKDEQIGVRSAAAAMRQVARYPGQYNMLAICYFACDDKFGTLAPLFEAITKNWLLARPNIPADIFGAAEQ